MRKSFYLKAGHTIFGITAKGVEIFEINDEIIKKALVEFSLER